MEAPRSHRLADWVQVAEASQLWQAELIAGRLREGGIETQIVDQTFHQEPLPNVRAFAVVRVLVPATEQEMARRLLAEGVALPEDVELSADETDSDVP